MKSKAIFLLVVFLLNTVVGFACALGMETNGVENHSHAESVHHSHQDHDHQHSDSHEHNSITVPGLGFSKEDHCCKTLVNDLVTQSKLVPENGKVQVVLPILLFPTYSYLLLVPVTSIESDQSIYVDQRERPPNQDIRIIIKSFQI